MADEIYTAAQLETAWTQYRNDRDAELGKLYDANGNPKHPPGDLKFHREMIERESKVVQREMADAAKAALLEARKTVARIEVADPTTKLTGAQLERASAMMSITTTDFSTVPEDILAQRVELVADTGDTVTTLVYLKAAQSAMSTRFAGAGQGFLLRQAMRKLEPHVVDVKKRDEAAAQERALSSFLAGMGAQSYVESAYGHHRQKN